MGTTLVICLFFLETHLHAEGIALSSSPAPISTSTTAAPDISTRLVEDTTAPSAPDDELAKIAASCLTPREHEQLAGDVLRYGMARILNVNLAEEAQEAIGLQELRAVAGFAPPGPWTAYREPSAQIAAAPTVEAYYELREPRSEARSLDSDLFFEKNFPPAIAFLDARFPAIRALYRRKFKEIRGRRQVAIDRKEVDRMIDEYIAISARVNSAIEQMFLRNSECARASRLRHDLHK